MTEISFFCAGIPVQQGSMKAISIPGKKHSQLIPTNDAELKRWRSKVAELAGLAANRNDDWPRKCQSAVHLTCRFLLPMPAARPAAVRKQEIGLCGVVPDLDKLLRAIGDGLTDSEVIADDARIVKGGQVKYEVVDHRLCGAEIVLRIVDLVAERDAMFELLRRRQENYTLPIGSRRGPRLRTG